MAETPLFAGIARKIVLLFIVLSNVGWIVFVAGFGEFVKELKTGNPNYNPGEDATAYPFWTASVFGPVVYLLAGVHALISKQLSGVFGSITALFFMMYITALSYGLVFSGMNIHRDAADKSDKLFFAGGFIAALGCTGVLALWPWYKMDPNNDGYSGL